MSNRPDPQQPFLTFCVAVEGYHVDLVLTPRQLALLGRSEPVDAPALPGARSGAPPTANRRATNTNTALNSTKVL